MYPIAHAWLVTQLVDTPTDAHYLGCVWPDMLFGGPLDHTRSHRSGRALASHAASLPDEREGNVFRQFVAGVLTHGSDPHGFDWYSDEAYGDLPETERGYAFQHGRELSEAAARACGLPSAQGWWKAHNIIEMAFERALWQAHPSFGAHIERACADEKLIQTVSRELSHVFLVPQAELALAIRRFPEVVALHPDSVTELAEVYALQTRLKHSGSTPDVAALAKLIAHAEEMIQDSKGQFLDACVERVGAMLSEVLPV